MSSLSEIYFNYNKAVEQANQLDDIAKRLNNAASQDVEKLLNDINTAWKSDSTAAYIKKGQKVEADMRTTVNNIKNIAGTIRTIAKRIFDAEMEAWRIANERNG